jgi:hypothetical protein
MKRIVWMGCLAAFTAALGSGPAWAYRQTASGQCLPDEKALIESEVRCFSGAGLDIGYLADDGLKVACMENKQVQSACGPDGRLTRLHAYSAWFTNLKQFEAKCNESGGVFAYGDPNFSEPQNESFCLQAQPEVGTNMFEGSLCNYRSICPSVAVVCEHPCGDKVALNDGEFATQAAWRR